MLAAEVLTDTHQLAIQEREAPRVPEGGALIQVDGCGVCGSDLDKLIHGKALPKTVLGHEIVGRIVALGEGYQSSFSLGDRIVSAHHVPCGHCQYCVNHSPSMCPQFKETHFNPGGFAQYLALSEAHLNHVAFLIPAGVSDEVASCVEPLGCVLRAVERSGSLVTPTVAVVGMGFIGMLAAQAYQKMYPPKAHVVGLDTRRDRLVMAEQHQFIHCGFHPVEDTALLTDYLVDCTEAAGVDVVFLSVVTPGTVAQALKLLRDGGRLILFASPQKPVAVSIDPMELYFREISVIPSYSPSVNSLCQAASWIFNSTIQVADLISHRVPLAQLPQSIAWYRDGEAMKVFVDLSS